MALLSFFSGTVTAPYMPHGVWRERIAVTVKFENSCPAKQSPAIPFSNVVHPIKLEEQLADEQ